VCLLFAEGKYIYFETSQGASGAKAQLSSPSFTVTRRQTSCLSFWYHMFGDGVNNLNVYLKSGNNLGRPVFQKHGNQGNQWKQTFINIRNKSNVKVSSIDVVYLACIFRFYYYKLFILIVGVEGYGV
jgi:hypothetical protein